VDCFVKCSAQAFAVAAVIEREVYDRLREACG
jgi:hypothetical protein